MEINRQLFWKILVIITLTVSLSSTAQVADYEEQGGVVVIEAESLDIEGTGWVIESEAKFSGYTGAGYLRSKTKTNNRENDKFELKIRINTTGKYIFKWRAQVGTGTENGSSNDSWVKFPDASDFYAEKVDSKVYPKGYSGVKIGETDIIPDNRGPGVDGWFKVATSGGVGNWVWWAATYDFQGYKIFVDFDTPGIYTLQIAHRSLGNLIDRIVLSSKEVDLNKPSNRDAPEDAETPEIGFTLAITSLELKNLGISIYPIPAQDVLNITGVSSQSKIELVDMFGRVLPVRIISITDARTQLDLSGLAKGIYFVSINGATGSFMK